MRVGLIPDCGGTYALPRLVGLARALGMTLLGDTIDARTAADWGLIWKVSKDKNLMSTAMDSEEALPLTQRNRTP